MTSCPSRLAGLVAALTVAALTAVACDDADSTPIVTNGLETATPDPTLVATASPEELIEVRLGDLVIRAEPARTPQERAQGLSDRESMPDDAGMLFFFSEERIPGFTMRRMQFPLDFVWISAGKRIVDLTEDVPHPDAAGEELSGISPSAPVLYVLEVHAGVIAGSGVQIGDTVEFEE